jgi:hypothetical protein
MRWVAIDPQSNLHLCRYNHFQAQKKPDGEPSGFFISAFVYPAKYFKASAKLYAFKTFS